MRDNFNKQTKDILAARVAYRCSFIGCKLITIWPGSQGNEHVISIGEAAHIYSAAPNGPRNNPSLTSKQRSSVDNGIWMCKSHARLIDVDEKNYSAETLMKWKTDAENFVRERLETLEREQFPAPLTLVMLNIRLIFQGRWIYVKEETWKFQIYNFIEGDMNQLKEYISSFSGNSDQDKYVVVESQGDGRLMSAIALEMDEDAFVISCELMPKMLRTNPHDVGGDLAMGDDGDLVIADNDLGMVFGIDCALQTIRVNLSSEFGWWANPSLGSNFNAIYMKYSQNESLLNSITKLEIVRMLTVPPSKGIFDNYPQKPEFNFINRINWVLVPRYDSSKPYLPVTISLEWGNYESWEGEVKIPFRLDDVTTWEMF